MSLFVSDNKALNLNHDGKYSVYFAGGSHTNSTCQCQVTDRFLHVMLLPENWFTPAFRYWNVPFWDLRHILWTVGRSRCVFKIYFERVVSTNTNRIPIFYINLWVMMFCNLENAYQTIGSKNSFHPLPLGIYLPISSFSHPMLKNLNVQRAFFFFVWQKPVLCSHLTLIVRSVQASFLCTSNYAEPYHFPARSDWRHSYEENNVLCRFSDAVCGKPVLNFNTLLPLLASYTKY